MAPARSSAPPAETRIREVSYLSQSGVALAGHVYHRAMERKIGTRLPI